MAHVRQSRPDHSLSLQIKLSNCPLFVMGDAAHGHGAPVHPHGRLFRDARSGTNMAHRRQSDEYGTYQTVEEYAHIRQSTNMAHIRRLAHIRQPGSNLAHARQSRPDSGLGFEVKVVYYKPVEARLWPWLSGKVFELSPLCYGGSYEWTP